MTEQDQTNIDAQAEALLRQPTIDPEFYWSTTLRLFHDNEADYRGARSEDQQIIAEYAAEEADEHFDLAMLGIASLSRALNPAAPVIMPTEKSLKETTLGNLADGVTLNEMRNAWRQLWVGTNILTHRLRRDSEEFQSLDLPEIFDMADTDKKAFKDMLFNNFQDLNALRFGATGSGLRRHRWVPNPDGGRAIQKVMDRDKARNDKEIAENAARRRYTAGRIKDGESKQSISAAGKMTPEELRLLRKQHPEVDMDIFAHDAAYMRDMAKNYEENQE